MHAPYRRHLGLERVLVEEPEQVLGELDPLRRDARLGSTLWRSESRRASDGKSKPIVPSA